jgi:hypothetical protein
MSHLSQKQMLDLYLGSDKAAFAVALAHENGAVYPGTNVFKGAVYRVNVSTIRALERRGLLTTHLSPDGGMMARLASLASGGGSRLTSRSASRSASRTVRAKKICQRCVASRRAAPWTCRGCGADCCEHKVRNKSPDGSAICAKCWI